MFRKLVLSVAASLALLTLPAFTSSAAQASGSGHGHYHPEHRREHHRASPGGDYRGHVRGYYVYYRHGAGSPWTCYGAFDSYSDALAAADGLAGNGYDSFVR